jgi:hypothetical protein
MMNIDKQHVPIPHMSVSDFKKVLHPDFFEGLFKFAIVRNPWDRAVSIYHFNHSESFRESNPDLFEYVSTMNFEQFLESEYASVGLQQLPWITIDGEIAVDYVGRFEQLYETTIEIAQRTKTPQLSLAHLNQTSHMSYQDYYTDYTRKIIAQKCEKDIDTFNYTFELKPQHLLL